MSVQTFTPEETRQIVQTITLVNARLDAVDRRLDKLTASP